MWIVFATLMHIPNCKKVRITYASCISLFDVVLFGIYLLNPILGFILIEGITRSYIWLDFR